MQQFMGEHMLPKWSLLMGRVTYQRFASYWPTQANNPFTKILNDVTKYVASQTLKEAPSWQNSVLLTGDVPAAVHKLKAERPENLVIFGSGVLVRSLMDEGLIDEFVFMVHPLVLGSGRRLFLDGGEKRAGLELVRSATTSAGVVMSVYKPAKA